MRLAWFSPWPPDPSGIATRSAELLPLIARRGHAVDVFVDGARVPDLQRAPDTPPEPGEIRVQSAHDFVWRARRSQYDLPIYQVGNSKLHAFIWPYLCRVPGLAVLHDARLHHARGHALLSRKRKDAYRAEFAWSEPAVSPDAAELAVAGFDGRYYYQWPMTRAVVESSRLVAAHSAGAVAELARTWPDRPFCHIALGEGLADPIPESGRRQARTALGLPDHVIVFGVFGALTAEKRIEPILRAFGAIHAQLPGVHLLLAGQPDARLDLGSAVDALGLAGAVTVTGRLDDRSFDAAVAAADVSLNLRWPTSLEMSGPWLRALSAARPTVVVDLAHLSDVPALDPRIWQLHGPARRGGTPRDAVTIAVDILDEEHSLRVAMRRLATDPDFRAELGRAGRAYWEREHTVDRMAGDYEAAMARAIAKPAPAARLPAHLRPDPLAHTRALLAPFDLADRPFA